MYLVSASPVNHDFFVIVTAPLEKSDESFGPSSEANGQAPR